MRSLLSAGYRLAGTGVLALASGCISPTDPYFGDRPAAPSLISTARSETSGPVRPASATVSTNAADSKPPAPPEPQKLPEAPAPPQKFTPDEAVSFALQNNPALQAVRLQRGFAQGGVVIGRTYPYNPIAETYELPDSGPKAAGITNRFTFQATVRLDLELRGQGKHRLAAAEALLSRTEWEIATQELQVSVATMRSFNTVLYRQRKLDVQENSVKLTQTVVDLVKKLVEAGRLRPADLIVARTELDTTRALIGQGRVSLATARYDLLRQLGIVDDSFEVAGELDLPLPTTDLQPYLQAALQVRPDLQARKVAVTESQARLRLQEADRYGNISFGPSYQVDDNSTNYFGAAFFAPIPVLNTHRGEIMQARATVARSQADVRQLEVQSQQEVQGALARLVEAHKWASRYASEVLPNLRKSLQDMELLLQQNDPGVDVIKVIDVQRNYLRAFDAYLDALYEVSLARADLAGAVGDPALALGLYGQPRANPVIPPAPSPPLNNPPK